MWRFEFEMDAFTGSPWARPWRGDSKQSIGCVHVLSLLARFVRISHSGIIYMYVYMYVELCRPGKKHTFLFVLLYLIE